MGTRVMVHIMVQQILNQDQEIMIIDEENHNINISAVPIETGEGRIHKRNNRIEHVPINERIGVDKKHEIDHEMHVMIAIIKQRGMTTTTRSKNDDDVRNRHRHGMQTNPTHVRDHEIVLLPTTNLLRTTIIIRRNCQRSITVH